MVLVFFLHVGMLLAQDVSHVKTVLVGQTCHLDVGFALTAAGELDNYRKYYLEAAATAESFRQLPAKHGEGLIFTTHPYVVSLLLDCPLGMGFTCPTSQERDIIISALKKGDIVMQAFPHNSETATLSPELFRVALQLGKNLSAALGVPHPTVMTQRDVPGATRSMVSLLVAADVKMYSGGVNTASLPPHVPRAFVWRDEASNTEILATVHPHGYGGITVKDCIVVDGLDTAFCPDYKGDNAGPWSRTEIEAHWKIFQKEFPQATSIKAASFDTFAAVLDTVRATLPVVTEEMGDTWIYGCPSDPLKVSMYREALRAFESCLATQQCDKSDPRIGNFTRLFLKNPEHTWGGDVKKYLHDETNWLNEDFHKLQFTASNFKYIAMTWKEQRDWGLTFPLEALQEHPLASDIEQRWAALRPHVPSLQGFTKVDPSQVFACGELIVGFDPTGAISHLADSKSTFASPSNKIAGFEYKVHSAAEYNRFFNYYAQRIDGKIPSYFPKDFGKPGLYNNSIIANQTVEYPTLKALYRSSDGNVFLADLSMSEKSYVAFGAPQRLWLKVNVTARSLDISLSLFNKTATRLPESMWATFNPVVSHPENGWTMDKLGARVDPLDVVVNGSRHLHAVDANITYEGGGGTVILGSKDAMVVSWGDTNVFPTPSGAWQPSLAGGVNFCLCNNIWGTNYVMWFPWEAKDKDVLFRFTLSFT